MLFINIRMRDHSGEVDHINLFLKHFLRNISLCTNDTTLIACIKTTRFYFHKKIHRKSMYSSYKNEKC